MRGKEGDVDIDGIIEMDYNDGVRAYRVDGCMVLHNSTGIQSFDELEPMSKTAMYFAKRWHALRAYQDEQRKKGVPIVMGVSRTDDPWRKLSGGYQFNYISAYDGCPRIDVYGTTTPFDQRITGRFTNFRWREGYPKKERPPTPPTRQERTL